VLLPEPLFLLMLTISLLLALLVFMLGWVLFPAFTKTPLEELLDNEVFLLIKAVLLFCFVSKFDLEVVFTIKFEGTVEILNFAC
jgi:hypothetical protein